MKESLAALPRRRSGLRATGASALAGWKAGVASASAYKRGHGLALAETAQEPAMPAPGTAFKAIFRYDIQEGGRDATDARHEPSNPWLQP